MDSSDPSAALEPYFASVIRCVERRDWPSARQHALKAAALAEASDDARAMLQAGDYLERFNDFGLAGRLMAKGGRITAQTVGAEWDGTDVDGTLLIENRIRHVGAPIRMARLLRLVGRHARRCIVSTDPRLVPLFSRTFPDVEIRAAGGDDEEARRQADVVASFETLMQHLAPDAGSLAVSFSPLLADAGLVRRFRQRYQPAGSDLPVVGVAWTSTNKAKDLPPVECWAGLLRDVPARFVSLQYGDVAADLASFHRSGIAPLIDPTVDSLRDLDSFAAQVASLDAVVTISNTAAHMAGALGVPTVVMLDDKFHLIWPVAGDRTPWYPQTVLVRRQGRHWAEAFVEVRHRLQLILGDSPRSDHRCGGVLTVFGADRTNPVTPIESGAGTDQIDPPVACETLDRCPICGGGSLREWRRSHDRDLRVTRQEFTYSACLHCDVIFLSTRPIESEAYRFYPLHYGPYQPAASPAQASEGQKAGEDTRGLSAFGKTALLKAARGMNAVASWFAPDKLPAELQTIYRPAQRGARLLDFGCGSDRFLNSARRKGWSTIGIDFSPQTIEQIRRSGHEGFLVGPSLWEEIDDNSIDVVRMNHVLEHLYSPREVLTHLKSKMRSGGMLHIAVPNPNSITSHLFRSRWWGLECPRHVMLFTPAVLRRLLASIGFSEIRVRHEIITKDFARSLGYFLHDRGRIRHEAVTQMMHRQDLAELLRTPAILAAACGAADRFHVFARK